MAESRRDGSGAARRAVIGFAIAAAASSVGALPFAAARAQAVPPTATPPVRDTTPRVTRDTSRGPRRRPTGARRSGLLPPITPGRAFFSSLLVPGLGQSRLQRPTAGAIFVGLEFGIVAMLIKSNADLHSARGFGTDSVATSYPLDSTGTVVAKIPQQINGLGRDLVNARRLHREDWIAALVFNHLISGAEAFVSANLYDLPAQITARPTPQGTAVALSIPW